MYTLPSLLSPEGIKMLLIICPLVFLAGLIDAISGGGGLLSLPAYTFAGLPIHNAIATNKMSSFMGTTLATGTYIAKGYVPWPLVPISIFTAFLGSNLGARLALMLTDHYFKLVLLVIIPIVAFYVLKSKNLNDSQQTEINLKTYLISGLISLAVGIYDGFYGPGTGTFLILLLTGFTHMSLTNANGLTKIINWTTNLSALVVYLMNGKTLLLIGLIAGSFNIAGNYIGANMFSKGGSKYIRPFLLLVLILFYIKLITDLFI